MQKGEIIIYQLPDGSSNLDVRLEDEPVWLSLNQISVLFDRDKSVISRHTLISRLIFLVFLPYF